ncbi:hypothetical protein HMPREF9554_02329, partial [Treponema phagedenis F0421]|uniref:hypothetical protein n=1 Tax=Treponema phagedenis TaxID=162 RepID=UPI0001F640DB
MNCKNFIKKSNGLVLPSVAKTKPSVWNHCHPWQDQNKVKVLKKQFIKHLNSRGNYKEVSGKVFTCVRQTEGGERFFKSA